MDIAFEPRRTPPPSQQRSQSQAQAIASPPPPPPYNDYSQSGYIYQYERDLTGILNTLHSPMPQQNKAVPSLGDRANEYLRTHGYRRDAWLDIAAAYDASDDNTDNFVMALASQGAPVMELKYLFGLITPGAQPRFVYL